MKRLLEFLVMIVVVVFLGFIVVVYMFKSNSNIYKKLYNIYKKDSSYNCNDLGVCKKDETKEINGKKYTIRKVLSYDIIPNDHDLSNYKLELIVENEYNFTGELSTNYLVGEPTIDFKVNSSLFGEVYGSYRISDSQIVNFDGDIYNLKDYDKLSIEEKLKYNGEMVVKEEIAKKVTTELIDIMLNIIYGDLEKK